MSHHHYEDVIDPQTGKTYAQTKDENKMTTPDEILRYSSKFKDGSWRNYSYEELAQWVQLLTKRASHRMDFNRAEKDLYDANNYLEMLKAKFDEDAEKIENSFEGEE